MTPTMDRVATLLPLSVAALLLAGCSVNSYVAGKLGTALTQGGSSWSTEDDPELVRDALPFALKTMESLAQEAPQHTGLQLGLCRGYSSYAGGFLEPEAEAIEAESFERAKQLRLRAERLYLRAFGYCKRALDLDFDGAGGELEGSPAELDAALSRVSRQGVETLYWTGVAWGSAISLGLDRPERVAQLPTVRAIFERALVLDEAWDRGSLHEALLVFDSMPAMMGGSASARAAAFRSRHRALARPAREPLRHLGALFGGGAPGAPRVSGDAREGPGDRPRRRAFRSPVESRLTAACADAARPHRRFLLHRRDR